MYGFKNIKKCAVIIVRSVVSWVRCNPFSPSDLGLWSLSSKMYRFHHHVMVNMLITFDEDTQDGHTFTSNCLLTERTIEALVYPIPNFLYSDNKSLYLKDLISFLCPNSYILFIVLCKLIFVLTRHTSSSKLPSSASSTRFMSRRTNVTWLTTPCNKEMCSPALSWMSPNLDSNFLCNSFFSFWSCQRRMFLNICFTCFMHFTLFL